MNTHSNLGDLPGAEDLPALSPGGVQELDGPQQLRPLSPTVNQEQDGAGHGALEAPMVPRHAAQPDEDMNEEDEAEMDGEPGAVPQDRTEPPPGGQASSWQDALQGLPQEDQELFESFFGRTLRFVAAPPNSLTEGRTSIAALHDYLLHYQAIQLATARLDPETTQLLGGFFHLAAQEISRITHRPPRHPRAQVHRVLDQLTTTNPPSLLLAAAHSNSSITSCTICLENYVESDVVVVLPCHISHHFHQRCIRVSCKHFFF